MKFNFNLIFCFFLFFEVFRVQTLENMTDKLEKIITQASERIKIRRELLETEISILNNSDKNINEKEEIKNKIKKHTQALLDEKSK
jgi:hypothetical protein